jgi:phosphoribosylformylglycinamidine synthase
MKKSKICILRTAGTNCDKETAYAFKKAEGIPELVHINQLIAAEKSLDDYHILAIPGGFSYGDDLGAGKILANELRFKLIGSITKFLSQGKLIIGICNGFQVLVKSGLLPGDSHLQQHASLIINDSGKFEDRWVYLKSSRSQSAMSQATCVWTAGLPEIIYLPVAHGEGKFVCQDNVTLEGLRKNGRIVFQYCGKEGACAGYPHNPNGSEDNIAGICDSTGHILGLMPHPERHIDISQHPRWEHGKIKTEGDGILIFRNGVEYAERYL